MVEDTQLHMEKWTRLLVIVSALLVLMIFMWALIQVLGRIQHTVLLFSLGALVAYALEPLVAGLRRRPVWPPFAYSARRRGVDPTPDGYLMSRNMAISVVFLGLVVLFAIGVYSLSRPLAYQVRILTSKHEQAFYKARADDVLTTADRRLDRAGVHWHLDAYLHNPRTIPPQVQEEAANVERSIIPFLKDFAVSIGESVIVLLISLYLLIYGGELREKCNAQLPSNLRSHAEVWEEDVNRILGGFVRGQIVLSFVMGGSAAIACLVLGIHIWLIIGIFVTITALIPVFGPYLGAVPAIIAALIGPTNFHSNVAAAIVVLIFFVVINEVGSKILYPRLVGQAIGLHEVLVLFVIFAGLELGGVVGVLFAAPLTAVGLVTIIHLYRFWLELPDSLLSRRAELSALYGKDGGGKSDEGGAAPAGAEVSDFKSSVNG